MADDRNARRSILGAAIEIIDREGESAIRVDRVVRDAGFTRPVLYSYFADKDDLIVRAQAERYRRALEWGMSDVMTDTLAVGDRAEFVAAMRGWMASFNTTEGERRRQLRIEVLGSSISRPGLRDEVQRVKREFILQVAGFLAMVRDRWDLPYEFEPLDLAAWWVGLILSRHLVEADQSFVDPKAWDAITDAVVVRLLALDDR